MDKNDKDESGIGGYVFVALAAGSLVYFVTARKEAPSPPPTSYIPTPAPMSPASNVPAPAATKAPPPKPRHYYDSAEGTTYFYSAAVSEEERRTGKIAPDALSFRYLGRDEQGRDMIQHVSSGPGQISYCARPCKIIHRQNGSSIGYDERSVIGSAIADAQRGFLRKYRAPIQKAEPWTDYSSDPVVSESEQAQP